MGTILRYVGMQHTIHCVAHDDVSEDIIQIALFILHKTPSLETGMCIHLCFDEQNSVSHNRSACSSALATVRVFLATVVCLTWLHKVCASDEPLDGRGTFICLENVALLHVYTLFRGIVNLA